MPTTPSVSWDENSPNGSQAISLGDDRIRELKTSLREVIAQDHKMASSGQTSDTGFHNQVTLIEQASAPTTTGTNYIALYGKEVAGLTELFIKIEAGTEIQLTSGGKLLVTNSNGLLAVIKGGTGLSSLAQGDLLYASAADTLFALAKDANATRYLANTGSSNNPAWAQVNIANGIVIASQAQGDLIYASSASAFARLPAGTSGQYLQTQGVGANPQWASFTTPALTLASTTTWSGAATSGNIAITNTKRYLVIVQGMSGSNQSSVYIRFNADATATKYKYVSRGYDTSAVADNVNSTSADKVLISGNIYQSWYEMVFYILPQNGTSEINVHGKLYGDSSYHDFFGRWSNAAAATSFVLAPSVGTFSGTVKLYEIT